MEYSPNILPWFALTVVVVMSTWWGRKLWKKSKIRDGTESEPAKVKSDDKRLIDATECGHKTKIEDSVTAFGETTETQVPVNEDGTTPYCHKCLEKMAIRCAWCGLPIFVGDPITLYSSRNRNEKMPDHAVLHDEEHNS